MHTLVGPRLAAMMFLQFFIWGSWYVTGPNYLGKIGFDAGDIGWTYSVGPIAGILAPFFVGMFADRFFRTERILGVLHLLGAGAMFTAMQMMGQASPSPDTINILFFVHMLCYFPTLSLTNSLALSNMTNAESQFPLIRVFGTLGWILAGVTVDQLGWTTSREMFMLPVGCGVWLGFYSFTLPHTPPPLAGQPASPAQLAGADAFVLLKKPSFLVFMVSSFLICIPLAFYYQLTSRSLEQTGVENVGTTMSLGQASEVIFMVMIPLFFKRLGVKWMLLVGMACWVLRYGLFAVGAQQPSPVAWMMIVGILLHGICYDFFFVTGQIYTDKAAPERIRGQAQGLLVLCTLGLGMLIGAQVASYFEGKYTPPAAVALYDEVKAAGDKAKQLQTELDELLDKKSTEQQAAFEGWKSQVDYQEKPLPEQFADELQPAADLQRSLAAQAKLQGEKKLAALKLLDWKMIWGIPCAAAAVVMVLFALFFKDDVDTTLPGEETESKQQV